MPACPSPTKPPGGSDGMAFPLTAVQRCNQALPDNGPRAHGNQVGMMRTVKRMHRLAPGDRYASRHSASVSLPGAA